MSAPARPVLTVDTAALAANWRLLRDRCGAADCAAVVKADAYGTDIAVAVPALAGAGCTTFFVAVPDEGVRVRAMAPEATVYVLNGFLPGWGALFAAHRLRPVLGSLPEHAEWTAFCAATGADPAAALHVDTGMNRLGVPMDGLDALSGAAPALLMTHLVAADERDHPLNRRQLAAFAEVRRRFPGIPGSFANSSGLFLGAKAIHDLGRPGYALYGGNPTPGRPNPMRPVVTLEAPIVQVNAVGPGDTVGYGAVWTAPSRRRLATIPVGYADGYPRAASATDGRPGGMALVGGVPCPFAGRVSMDLIVIDVTDAPDAAVERGAPVTLIGPDLPVDAVAARADTIGYTILTGLGRRFARRIADA